MLGNVYIPINRPNIVIININIVNYILKC